jgi:hypothetical protein
MPLPLRFVPILFGLLILFASGRAEAYPWMIKHGYTNCGGCHVDPSGGELLTLYGHAISSEALTMKYGRGESSAARDREYERRIVTAIARAGHAKSAPKKKIAAEKVNLDDEPAPAAKPAAAPAKAAEAAPEAAPAAAAAAPAAAAEQPAAKKPSEDSEEAAEEEGGTEAAASASSEGSTESSADSSGGSTASPFEGMAPMTGPLFGLIRPSEAFLIGGSVRVATLYKLDAASDKFSWFPMQLDVYGQLRFLKNFRAAGSIGAAKVPVGSPNARAAQVTQNQGDGYNVISRTHWIGYDFGEGAHTVRAGRLQLPFGIRMSEHVMWVRDKTQTDRESDQQHGVALAMGWEKTRFEVMGILGNFQISPPFREKGYSGYGETIVAENFALGVNSLMTIADNDRTNPEGLKTARGAHGLFLRAGPNDKVAILAEADLLTRSRRNLGYVGFLQFDVEPVQGLHTIATGEFYDMGWTGGPNGTNPRTQGQGKPALGAWLSVQWFFLTHFDFRLDAILRAEKQIMGQLHVYL